MASTPAAAHHRARSQLRLLLTLCLAIPLLLFLALAAYSYAQVMQSARDRLDRSLRVANEHTLRVLDTNEMMLGRVLEIAGQDLAKLNRPRLDEIHRSLRALAEHKPQVQSIWIWGPDGRPLASNRFSPVPASVDVSDREFFLAHKAGHPGVYVTGPLKARATGESFFDLSMARREADGSFAGLVSVGLFPAYFEQFYENLVANEPGLTVTLLRRDGAVYARSPSAWAAKGAQSGWPVALPRESELLRRLEGGQAQGFFQAVSPVDGEMRLIGFQQVGEYPIFVATGFELNALRASWLKELTWLGAFGALPLAGFLVSTVLVWRRTNDVVAAAERLRTEIESRRQMEDALRQSQKLEAMGHLTGGVAHDFNNLLMVFQMNSMLLRRLPPGAGQVKQLDAIDRAVTAGSKLTRQLLAFSHRQPLLPQRVDFLEAMPALMDLIRPIFGSRVELTTELSDDIGEVILDVSELELAMINLSVNAKDALPDSGGRVTIRVFNKPAAPLSGERVVVEFSDNGRGIEPEVLGRVFEPFFTTKSVGKGSGLGLSQVCGLCTRAGGTARVESVVGEGTTVRLEFPQVTDKSESHQVTRPPAALQQLALKVLLVEDNSDVGTATQEMLESLGSQVVWNTTAAQALDTLGRSADGFDVILSDIIMPGEMDGLGMLAEIRNRGIYTPVVMMTGYVENLERARGLTVLPKPFGPDTLADALRAAVRGARARPRSASPRGRRRSAVSDED